MSDKIAKPKSRLGRGLSSLISLSTPEEPPEQLPAIPAPAAASAPSATAVAIPPDVSAAPAPGVRVADIPLSAIVPNPHQPRRQFNEASLNELAASMKSAGLIQPVIVRPARDGQGPTTDGPTFQLIAGERRWRAARLAGLSVVPALIRDVDTVTQAQMALIENIQREDLNPIDRALAYNTLLKQLGLTQAELAGRLGEDRTTVTHFCRLLELPQPVQELIHDGRLTLGHAKLLAGITDPAAQTRLAQLAVEQNLSVRNLERLVQDPAAEPSPPAKAPEPPKASAHLQQLERSLSRQLNLRVQIRSSNRKGHGRLVLHYSSLDQFDDLMGRLGVRVDDE
jgi:ParB family chromosome partitioning protein